MPVSNATIQIRLTSTEKEEIVRRMQAEGCHNLSQWIRKKLLKCPCSTKGKIEEIYRYVMKREEEEDDYGGGEKMNEEFSASAGIPDCNWSFEMEE